MSAGGSEHPSHLTLSRFVDGDLSAEHLPEVSRHVEACDECRDDVQFIRRLGATARSLEMTSPPDVVEEVIRRRRAGERGHPAGRATGGPMRGAVLPHRFAGAVAAGLALAVVASFYLLLAPTAAATRGELRFGAVTADARADGGAGAVPVVYTPAFYLAHEDSLRLRARVSRATDPGAGGNVRRAEEIRVATLHRARDGTYRGQLPREPGDLFAVAAVEDVDAIDLDTNFGRLWDLYLERDAGGQPTMAALESRYRALESYNWVLAGDWAKGLTEQYPGNPLGWALHYSHLLLLHPDGVADTLRAGHLAKLDEMTGSSGSSLEPAELSWLIHYATRLGAATVRDSLLVELTQQAPNHPTVIDAKAIGAVLAAASAAERLARLEELWLVEDRPTPVIIFMGMHNAAASGDVDALQTWLRRGRLHPGVRTSDLIDAIAPYDIPPRLRSELLRLRLSELEAMPLEERSLRETSAENAAAKRGALRALKSDLASALMASGDTLAASRLYADVAEDEWRADNLVRYVDFLLSRGDTVTSLPYIGLLLVDPISSTHFETRYRDVVATRGAEAQSLLEQSRQEFARRLLRSFPRDQALPGDFEIHVRDGVAITAREFFADGPTVVVLRDPTLTGGENQLGEDDSLTSALDRGTRVAFVTAPSDPIDKKPTMDGRQFLIDPDHGLAARLRVSSFPSYAVVDEDRFVVARVKDPADAVRIAEVVTW